MFRRSSTNKISPASVSEYSDRAVWILCGCDSTDLENRNYIQDSVWFGCDFGAHSERSLTSKNSIQVFHKIKNVCTPSSFFYYYYYHSWSAWQCIEGVKPTVTTH